jgi:ubiquinone/menaquinone biosynthesis C-methylase UbiE
MKKGSLNKYYKKQARIYDLTRPLFLIGRKKAIKELNVRNGETVIDFACGTGLNIPYLQESGARVIGIDYSKALLEQARRKYPSINFIKGDVSRFRFKEKVDAIICTYGLSMVDEWEKAVLNMKNTLNKRGRLVVLDFYHWTGVCRMFYPIFRWWAQLNGVDPDKNVLFFLKQHFKNINEEISFCGYSYIVTARNPK